MKTYKLEKALLNRNLNKYSVWHKVINEKKEINSASRRVGEEYLPLNIEPSFKYKIEEPIFTMGSCFARRLENTLYKRGSNVPMYKGMIENKNMFENSTSFNKYNTFSMLYELEWALNEKDYKSSDSIIKLSDSKFMDLQLVLGNFNPDLYENILQRKMKIFSLTKNIINARVIALTLGLIEVWYDNETNRYLNIVPDIKFAKKNKNRFEIRLLGVDENVENLNKIYKLICKYNKNFKMIVTVSPVPLLTTFTENDIIIANTLSKSILVSAAHTFAWQHENIDYFPSYEIAMLSKKNLIWEDDLRHVSAKGADFIIETFLKNYI